MMLGYLIDTGIEMAEMIAALAALVAVAAVIVGPRRLMRVLHAIIAVTRSHAPRWLVIALNVALAIPGPVDEVIVFAIIAGLVAVKPELRAALVTGISTAWAAA